MDAAAAATASPLLPTTCSLLCESPLLLLLLLPESGVLATKDPSRLLLLLLTLLPLLLLSSYTWTGKAVEATPEAEVTFDATVPFMAPPSSPSSIFFSSSAPVKAVALPSCCSSSGTVGVILPTISLAAARCAWFVSDDECCRRAPG